MRLAVKPIAFFLFAVLALSAFPLEGAEFRVGVVDSRVLARESYLGHSDWRLPDAKELQSILDYSRSPQATNSAAIDPVFKISAIKDEGGRDNYPCFWSSTTHLSTHPGTSSAVYLCFGEALGFMRSPRSSQTVLMDVHGAGAQRSDPKVGNAADYPRGRGPQGDVVRINHYVRMVRNLK